MSQIGKVSYNKSIEDNGLIYEGGYNKREANITCKLLNN